MTDKEAMKLALEALEKTEKVMKQYIDDGYVANRLGFVRNSITVLKEALTQPEQEPVAYINVEQRKLEWAKYMSWDTPTVVNLPKIPLYTTPPQRTWVGLTDEEMMECDMEEDGFVNARPQAKLNVQAKLKEKNHEHRG
jgi:hypothetical protein